MNNTKQKNVYYEYEMNVVDEDDETICSYHNNFWLGDETPLLQKAIEYKNSESTIEIVQWKLDRNFQSFHQGEYHPRYFEIYPIFGRDLEYSSLKYENLPKYIQKKINIIRKALA